MKGLFIVVFFSDLFKHSHHFSCCFIYFFIILQIKRVKEEMRYFKLELLNREENFNQKFGASPNVGVMQVIKPKNKNAKNKGGRGGKTSSNISAGLPQLGPGRPNSDSSRRRQNKKQRAPESGRGRGQGQPPRRNRPV